MKLAYPITILLFIFFVFNTLYQHFSPKSAKSNRIACHQEVTTFERLYEPNKLQKVKQLLDSQDFKLNMNIAKSHYMPTRIDSYLSIKQLKQMLEKTFGVSKGKKLLVNVLLYENDKKDPKKKSPKAKLYEGYVQINFVIDQKRIYSIQIDYKDKMGEDIAKRIDCAFKSLDTL